VVAVVATAAVGAAMVGVATAVDINCAMGTKCTSNGVRR